MPAVIEAGQIIHCGLVEQLTLIPFLLAEVTEHDQHACSRPVPGFRLDQGKPVAGPVCTGNIHFELMLHAPVIIHRHFTVPFQQQEYIFAQPGFLRPFCQCRQHAFPGFIDIDYNVVAVGQHNAVLHILNDLLLRPGIQG
ncbi:hypothetical protein D3C80_1421090 [compost metagenome]